MTGITSRIPSYPLCSTITIRLFSSPNIRAVTTRLDSAVVLTVWYADGMLESLEKPDAAPGRFTVTGLLSEVDIPGEWWFNTATRLLYVYPPETSLATKLSELLSLQGRVRPDDGARGSDVHQESRLGYWDGPGLITLDSCTWVTLRDVTVTGSTGTAVSISGGQSNTVGGSIFKNSAGGVAVGGGHANRVVGNDIFDVGSHLSVSGNPQDGLKNLVPTNNLFENNHLTQVFLRGTRLSK